MEDKQEMVEDLEDLEQVDPSAETKNADNDEQESEGPGPVPYDRFYKVNENYKAVKSELGEMREALEQERNEREKMRRKELQEQEKYQELAEEYAKELEELKPAYEAKEKEAKKMAEHLNDFIGNQLNKVPEVYRDILLQLPMLDQIQWLSQNAEKLDETKPSGVPKTPEPKRRGTITEEEKRKRAARTF